MYNNNGKPKAAAVAGIAENSDVPPTKVAASAGSFPDRDKCRVLILGCGNSTFGADMLRDGWIGGILNVDFSPTVICQMQQTYAAYAGRLDYVCADISLPLEFLGTASFDLIVCKGSLDAVLCHSRAGAMNMVSECTRLLAPGHGILFLVTSGNPDSRLEFLEYQNELSHYWRGVSVHPLKDEGHGAINTGGATSKL